MQLCSALPRAKSQRARHRYRFSSLLQPSTFASPALYYNLYLLRKPRLTTPLGPCAQSSRRNPSFLAAAARRGQGDTLFPEKECQEKFHLEARHCSRSASGPAGRALFTTAEIDTSLGQINYENTPGRQLSPSLFLLVLSPSDFPDFSHHARTSDSCLVTQRPTTVVSLLTHFPRHDAGQNATSSFSPTGAARKLLPARCMHNLESLARALDFVLDFVKIPS